MDVYKQPVTDPSKRSKRGRLSLRRNSDGFLETVESGAGKPEEVCTVFFFQRSFLQKFFFPQLKTDLVFRTCWWPSLRMAAWCRTTPWRRYGRTPGCRTTSRLPSRTTRSRWTSASSMGSTRTSNPSGHRGPGDCCVLRGLTITKEKLRVTPEHSWRLCLLQHLSVRNFSVLSSKSPNNKLIWKAPNRIQTLEWRPLSMKVVRMPLFPYHQTWSQDKQHGGCGPNLIHWLNDPDSKQQHCHLQEKGDLFFLFVCFFELNQHLCFYKRSRTSLQNCSHSSSYAERLLWICVWILRRLVCLWVGAKDEKRNCKFSWIVVLFVHLGAFLDILKQMRKPLLISDGTLLCSVGFFVSFSPNEIMRRCHLKLKALVVSIFIRPISSSSCCTELVFQTFAVSSGVYVCVFSCRCF